MIDYERLISDIKFVRYESGFLGCFYVVMSIDGIELKLCIRRKNCDSEIVASCMFHIKHTLKIDGYPTPDQKERFGLVLLPYAVFSLERDIDVDYIKQKMDDIIDYVGTNGVDPDLQNHVASIIASHYMRRMFQ